MGIEEGRLCGKVRRVAFIYELRIEPTGRKRTLRDASDSDDGREMGRNTYHATTPDRKILKKLEEATYL